MLVAGAEGKRLYLQAASWREPELSARCIAVGGGHNRGTIWVDGRGIGPLSRQAPETARGTTRRPVTARVNHPCRSTLNSWWRSTTLASSLRCLKQGQLQFGSVRCLPNTVLKCCSNTALDSAICVIVKTLVICRSKCGMPVSIVRVCHNLAQRSPVRSWAVAASFRPRLQVGAGRKCNG